MRMGDLSNGRNNNPNTPDLGTQIEQSSTNLKVGRFFLGRVVPPNRGLRCLHAYQDELLAKIRYAVA